MGMRFPRRRGRPAIGSAVAACLLSVAAAACASGGGGTPAAAPTHVAAPKKPTTITFVSWVGSQPSMKKLATQFHQKYPTITVNFINTSADSEAQKLTTMVAG